MFFKRIDERTVQIVHNPDRLFVYVAGAITPYESEHPVVGYWGNILRGLRISLELIFAGYIPFIPFADFPIYLMVRNHEKLTEDHLYAWAIGWLERCDVVLVLKKYRKSIGTLREIRRARELEMPVFYDRADLAKYREKLKKELI